MVIEMNTDVLAELKCQLNEAIGQANMAKAGFAAAAIDTSIVEPLEVFTRWMVCIGSGFLKAWRFRQWAVWRASSVMVKTVLMS